MEDKSHQELSALIIEDNLGDFVLIEEYLAEKFETFDLVHVETSKKAEDHLQNSQTEFDIILLDLSLPDLSGEELIKKILDLSKLTPVIILTGFSDLSFSIKSLSLGVSDYLIKDEISSALLQKSILHAIEKNATSKKIKESEKNYRDLFHLSPEPMFLYDLDGFQFIDVNEAAIHHYGYSKKEFQAMTFFDIVPKEDVNESIQTLNKTVYSDKDQYAGEFRHIKKNDQTILVSIHTRRLKYQGREVCMMISSDITQKRSEEEQLKLLESVITNSTEAVAIIEAETDNHPALKMRYVNEAFSKITGYSFEELVGNSLNILFGPLTDPSLQQKFNRAISDRQPVELEIIQHKKNESSFWAQLSMVPVIGKDGVFTHWIYMGRDITERKQTEEEIRYSKNQYQSLIDNVEQTIYRASADKEFTMIFMSPHIHEITGFPASDFIHNNVRRYSNLIHPDDREFVISEINDSINYGRNWEFEYRVIHKDSSTRWVYEKGNVQQNSDGVPTYCDGFILDITEKKRAEMGLENLNRQLEEKVEERTIQLKRVNKELESFSYSVSHDLRAPLRAIDGFSQAVLEGYADKLDETGVGYLNRVRSASQKLSHLIDEFLNLARVSRTEIIVSSVNLSKIATSIMEILKYDDPDRKVRISIEEGLIDLADGVQVKIILQNLLGNAWKYTSKSPDASISFGKTEKEGKPVYFVKDNGAGFNMDYVKKLFIPFQRLHHENDYPGTGIGLATVKRIIERHNGHVWAEGETGKGSIFYFTLHAKKTDLKSKV